MPYEWMTGTLKLLSQGLSENAFMNTCELKLNIPALPQLAGEVKLGEEIVLTEHAAATLSFASTASRSVVTRFFNFPGAEARVFTSN